MLLGDGGRFDELLFSDYAASEMGIVPADLDTDGDFDLISGEWVLLNQGAGQFIRPLRSLGVNAPTYCVSGNNTPMAVADFNGDTLPDFALAAPCRWSVQLVLSNP